LSDAPCPFCDFDEPEITLCSNRLAFAIISRAPINGYHALVIPYAHVERLPELSAEVAGAVIALAQRVARAIVAAARPDGVTYISDDDLTNQGYNLVPHWKLHVIARFQGEALRLDWARQPDPGQSARAELAVAIRKHLVPTSQ
jgi:histidine triad (HIT) family protein